MSPELEELIKKARESVARMTPEERATLARLQTESWVRAEAAWPKPKFRMVMGTKVYDSYEDFLNG